MVDATDTMNMMLIKSVSSVKIVNMIAPSFGGTSVQIPLVLARGNEGTSRSKGTVDLRLVGFLIVKCNGCREHSRNHGHPNNVNEGDLVGHTLLPSCRNTRAEFRTVNAAFPKWFRRS